MKKIKPNFLNAKKQVIMRKILFDQFQIGCDNMIYLIVSLEPPETLYLHVCYGGSTSISVILRLYHTSFHLGIFFLLLYDITTIFEAMYSMMIFFVFPHEIMII